ncbi:MULTISPECIES: hypothetical protein [unclassified Paenibacillus]|uniref:hypothetical protein n=1 Tax=unclassified Paenibacillus TaxID=185978 RepID=UPI001AEA6166|nr:MULTISPECIES: hypothetical protein [unclassified Paenibacillus]MBP1153455.1 hypothetical protein [Paenibacillus sp. PvP091]MBP1171162.1 hypothetical protein [Paenibacillus sp. PvR098]MBP2442190.1 hypothetical protein [Paenibacillus sp. PvP052]
MNSFNKPNERALSKDSTIYHYRLLKRIHRNPLYLYIYWSVLAIVTALSLFLLEPVPTLAGFVSVPILHAFILRLLLQTKEGQAPKSWRWSLRFPWLGYVPRSYISLAKVCRLHLQALWIIIVILGCFYPWLAPVFLAYLLFIHVWLLLPRLLLLYLLRAHMSNGYLIINENDTSCYAQ